jgi:hypothetical protein
MRFSNGPVQPKRTYPWQSFIVTPHKAKKARLGETGKTKTVRCVLNQSSGRILAETGLWREL